MRRRSTVISPKRYGSAPASSPAVGGRRTCRATSEEELYALAAKSPMGLSAALFTRDVGRAFRHAERIRCGIVNVNEASNYWEAHIPAGGAAGTTSGTGRTGGRHTLAEMSDLKTITFHIGD
jgi:succinate-semialdehyde dehydrogenase/glutarate-semialdehyde dehydrogenase